MKLKDFLGDADGMMVWKTENSAGLLKYKEDGEATIIEDIFRVDSDNSLKDLCDEFGVDFYE